MQKIYDIDTSIYRVDLIKKAVLDYQELLEEGNSLLLSKDDVITITSNNTDEIFFEFINYLIFIHVSK